jgi:cell division septum initiation protein DivIVA
MKALIFKHFILIAGVIILFTAGCAPQEPMSVKMSRIVAAENLKLKEDLRERDWEIKSLKESHQKRVEELEKTIVECKEKIRTWQEESRRNLREQVEDVADNVIARNSILQKENEALKEENKRLHKELNELKKKEDAAPNKEILL